jgi:hypothetical protein
MKLAATITFTPGTLIKRLISAESRAAPAIRRSLSEISESKNSIWRIAALTVSDSSGGNCTARRATPGP